MSGAGPRSPRAYDVRQETASSRFPPSTAPMKVLRVASGVAQRGSIRPAGGGGSVSDGRTGAAIFTTTGSVFDFGGSIATAGASAGLVFAAVFFADLSAGCAAGLSAAFSGDFGAAFAACFGAGFAAGFTTSQGSS